MIDQIKEALATGLTVGLTAFYFISGGVLLYVIARAILS